jgi:hypothetical protein
MRLYLAAIDRVDRQAAAQQLQLGAIAAQGSEKAIDGLVRAFQVK